MNLFPDTIEIMQFGTVMNVKKNVQWAAGRQKECKKRMQKLFGGHKRGCEVVGSNNNIVKEIKNFFTNKSSADEDFRCKTVFVSISPKPL